MKFKLDENIGERSAALLRAAGHDVATVRAQDLGGTTDENLFEVCAREKRALITLHHDSGQVLRFPPERPTKQRYCTFRRSVPAGSRMSAGIRTKSGNFSLMRATSYASRTGIPGNSFWTSSSTARMLR